MTNGLAEKITDKVVLFLGISYITYLYCLPIIHILSGYSFFISNLGRFFLVLIAFFLFLNERNITFLIRKRLHIYLISSYIIVLIGALVSDDVYALLYRMFFDVTGCWIVYSAFTLLSIRDKNQRTIAWTLAILATLNGVVGIYGALTGSKILNVDVSEVGFGAFGFDPETGRSGGIRGENYVGAWNAPGLALGLLLLFREGYFLKLIGLLFTLISSVSLVVSLSRTSVIAGSILIIIIMFIKTGRMKIRNLVVFSVTIFLIFQSARQILISQSTLFHPIVRFDIQRRWTLSEMLENERKYIYAEYLNTSLKRPIFGYGAGFIRSQFERGNNVPHNSFLDILVEHGIIGLILYLLPFLIAFKKLNLWGINRNSGRLGYDMRIFYFATFIAMTISLFFLSNPFFKMLWISMGCLEGTKKIGTINKNFNLLRKNEMGNSQF